MKLSADFSVRNLRLLLGKEFQFQSLDLSAGTNLKGDVLNVFPGGGWISIGGKRLRVSSKSDLLFVGEKLTLVAKPDKKGIELRIVERELIGKADFPHKLENVGMSVRELYEKVMGSDTKDVPSETSLFKVLKSYYPFLEWASELPYFRWEFDGGNAEGVYDPQKESKKFLFRIQTENTGRTVVLFLWKKTSGEDMQINASFDNLKMYLHACQNKENLREV